MSGQAAAPAAEATLRRLLGWVLLGYVSFVIYGSLVPLNYQPLPLAEAWLRFQATPMLSLGMGSRADLVANLLLFIPLSFLLREWFSRERPPSPWLNALLWLGCAALAVALEFTQEFFPGRTVSQNDMAAEAIGAALGLALHVFVGQRVRSWLSGWWKGEQGLPLARRILHGYLVGLLIFAVMPLDLTINPVDIFHKWREGRVRFDPTADLHGELAQVVYEVVTDLVLWMPVGALWRLGGSALRRVAMQGLLLAAALELLQLLVYTRVTATADILTGALGCVIGALCVRRSWRLDTSAIVDARSAPWASRRSWRWVWLYLGWLALSLAVFWFPFNVDWRADHLAQRWLQAQRVPFEAYYLGSEYKALNELLRRVLMFLPGGLLWAGHVAQLEPRHRRWWWSLGAMAVLAAATLVEAGQLLLPGKVADYTDVLLEASGGWLGLALGRRLWGLPQPPHAGVVRARPAGRLGMAVADGGTILLLAALLALLARLPGVPYNVKELLPATLPGALTALAVAAVVWWSLAWPLVLQAHWRARADRAVRLALWLPVMSLPPGLVLLLSAPAESLADIVGSPVLGGPAWLETLGRYVALQSALALAATGAVWLVARVASDSRIGLLPGWFLALLLWALPLHLVVVVWAATDNLTELMRDGGGLAASVVLFVGLLAMFAAATALAASLVQARQRVRLLVFASFAWPLAAAALWWGSEPMLFKYDKVFSAAQFLLSADRDHYASGMDLLGRFAGLCFGLTAVTALVQVPRWRSFVAR